MLQIGLSILAVAVVMAANGRFSPTAFGGGIGLVVLWYLFERERPIPPATEEELSTLSESLHESSTEFDLPDFPAFLRRIVPHITRGFGEREVSRLASLAGRLPRNRENQTEFQVVFQGAPTPLRVRLFRSDVACIGVHFFTSQALADLLDSEMDSFFAERGM
ncbi:MAG: hypothetical protein RL088_3670 [Verrucomicrobiota bacterium]|jgi:hypothetical protein